MENAASKEKQFSEKPDFICDLYLGGFDHVLEKIIFRLPLRTVLTCMEVSSEWRKMVLHFQESEVFRIQKLKDNRIHEEWRNKNGVISTTYLSEVLNKISTNELPGDRQGCYIHVQSFHSEKKEIFVHVEVLPKNLHLILVFDVKTMQLTNTLSKLKNGKEDLVSRRCVLLGMASDDNYLCVNVGTYKSDSFCLIWNRKDNYSFNSIRKIDRLPETSREGLVSMCISVKPFLHRGILYLPISAPVESPKLVLEVWDIEKGCEERVEKIFPSEMYYLLTDDSRRFFSRIDKVLSFHSGNDSSVFWSKKVSGKHSRILDVSSNYVVVYWGLGPINVLVEVYDLTSGTLVTSFEGGQPVTAQIANDLVAYSGDFLIRDLESADWLDTFKTAHLIVDTRVYDLKTGKKILSLAEDLNFKAVSTFELKKDRLFFCDRGAFHSVKFWL